jgi:hypothetical protein
MPPKKAKHTRPPGYTAERAKFWRVSLRVAQLWQRKAVPIHDTANMIAWYAALPAASQSKLTPAFRRRVTELRLAADRAATAPGSPPTAHDGDAEFAAFEKDYAAGAQHDKTTLADLKKQFAFYLYKQRQCTARNDQAGASEAMRQLTQLSSVIHDMELRAQKLGRDLGDLVPRRVLETTARTIAYHLLRCADTLIADLIAALTRRDPTGAPLTAEEIRQLAEPIILSASVVQPIVRASYGDNPAAPPDWLVAAFHAGIADVLENPPALKPSPSAAPATLS